MAHASVEQRSPSPRLSLVTRYVVFLHALLFVAGFSLTFIVGWGGAFTLLGQVFRESKTPLSQVGGVITILFGLVNLGVVRLPWLSQDLRPDWEVHQRSGYAASALMGMFFAAGWTPCIGTTLGAILTMSFSGETAGQAMLLSSGYALGLGIPFLLIGLGINRFSQILRRFRQYMRYVQIAGGLMIIGMGVLLLTDQMTQIAIWAQRNGLFLDLPLGGTSTPTYLLAVLAGVISFLSPCVLPLVPAYVGHLAGHVSKHIGINDNV